ncbi:hypothetical protein RUMGNA_02305 [Mediterraneibacter gnavus ATCC 29149]|uniref:Uncharacterized protein n=1 Tax=Mediterraneibacter gnavus (strain ATCC 29149 / DSM 114966 / JCM 6515 / VPI C7-9) TaxID=411470 RepID=A7B422_MEDG7|nr:hypothetical protein RUMGNA_02305 [Mediterraneibacter gnavus ATCC 29149]
MERWSENISHPAGCSDPSGKYNLPVISAFSASHIRQK